MRICGVTKTGLTWMTWALIVQRGDTVTWVSPEYLRYRLLKWRGKVA